MFENAVSAIVRKCTTCWKAWVGNNSILRDRESWGGDLSSVNLWRFDGRGGVGGQLLGFASVTVEKEQTLSINFSGDGVWKVIPRRLMIQAWCCWLKAQPLLWCLWMERVYLGVILHLLVFHQSVCVQFPSFPSAEKQRLSEGCQCAVIRYQRERGQWAGWQVAHPPDVRDQYPTTRIPNSSSLSSWWADGRD